MKRTGLVLTMHHRSEGTTLRTHHITGKCSWWFSASFWKVDGVWTVEITRRGHKPLFGKPRSYCTSTIKFDTLEEAISAVALSHMEGPMK